MTDDLPSRIIALLKQYDLLGSGDIARRLNQKQQVILTHLAILEKHGTVTHNAGSWRINK